MRPAVSPQCVFMPPAFWPSVIERCLEHGFVNVRNYLGACSAHESETGITDESAQVFTTRKLRKSVLYPVSFTRPGSSFGPSEGLDTVPTAPSQWTVDRGVGGGRDRREMGEREGEGERTGNTPKHPLPREHPQPPPAQGTPPITPPPYPGNTPNHHTVQGTPQPPSYPGKKPNRPATQGTPQPPRYPGNTPNHPTVQRTPPTTPLPREHPQPPHSPGNTPNHPATQGISPTTPLPREHPVHPVARVHLLDAARNVPPRKSFVGVFPHGICRFVPQLD